MAIEIDNDIVSIVYIIISNSYIYHGREECMAFYIVPKHEGTCARGLRALNYS